ncbi:putative phosphoesterase or phosphohydrolase [Roseovarius sp. EC-HK134]|uniref:metallophosphoesterase n=1 Tax=unclassified Roseovarius TaxID=2614913 RepID=UPI0012563DC0|nr:MULTISPECIES: metallophosphoesterase [unclassified Roseovarius]VVT22653.1 putative phosphoesterase or phosphohydrolase [Roseovarius sp. EC-SD190]VVT22900.1 putative phosphoesterase or phosphohydrolase [Roseovarius sp. EC-HK134]
MTVNIWNIMNFYTADPHFFHSNILKFCKRPFGSVGEMNRKILHNYQSTVSDDDDLWILGDVAVVHVDAAPELSAMLASIPGRKHLITGNHDKAWIKSLPVWTSVHGIVEIKDSGHRITLCHYPMITFAGARHGAVQLFGHVHGNWYGSRNSVNVGVDCWNFQPVTLKQVMERAETLPVNPLWSTVEPGTGA